MAAADYRLMTEATGQRIAAALESLVNLGDPVTIAHGGTGASTATAALTALGGVAVTDIVNNLTSTATNKPLSAAQGKALYDDYYTGRIFSQRITCTYMNSTQLVGTFTTPTAPAGYTVRACFARNLFVNNEVGTKCTGAFLLGADYLRVRGNGFVSTDGVEVLLYWEYIKS